MTIRRLEGGFLEFVGDWGRFVLSEHKVHIILKHIQELKAFWPLPIEPGGYYRIEPSGSKWRTSEIEGRRLLYLLSHAAEVNGILSWHYRLNDLELEQVKREASPPLRHKPVQPFVVSDDSRKLYRWQKEALEKWCYAEEKRGIVEAATGTGKTRLALECISRFFNDSPDGLVCIVVPRQPLFDQWGEALHNYFLNIPANQYCYYGNGHTNPVIRTTKVLLATQQAMVFHQDVEYGCELLKQLIRSGRHILLVMDEAHHLGAEKTVDRIVRKIPADFCTLGLTATPQRTDGMMDEVYDFFDCDGSEGPIYSYSLEEAVEEGVLTPVTQVNVFVSLSENELCQYRVFNETIGDLKQRLANSYFPFIDKEKVRSGNVEYLNSLERELRDRQKRASSTEVQQMEGLIHTISALESAYIQRRRILNKAKAKWHELGKMLTKEKLVQFFSSGRWIFFHKEREECERTAELLMSVLGRDKVRQHHAAISKKEREVVLRQFGDGQPSCLCTVQTVTEGVDVPDLKGVVIVSGSASKREQIQRCGRALRRARGKKMAYLFFFLVQGDNDLSGEKPLVGPQPETDKWKTYNF